MKKTINIPEEILNMYPESFMRKICSDLEISDENWSVVQEKLTIAAYFYNEFKERKKTALKNGEARKLMGEFIKSSNKMIELSEKLLNDFYVSYHLESIEYDNHFISHVLNKKSADSDKHAPKIEECLSHYADIFEEILSYKGKHLGIPPQYPLEDWTMRMKSLFKDSPIKFSKGEYFSVDNGETKYFNSDSLKILEYIMYPLDPEVTQISIANKMEAICKKDFI